MDRPETLTAKEATEKMSEIFEAARTFGPQVIEDDAGTFTLTYTPATGRRDARKFLAKGGPDGSRWPETGQ